MSLNKEDTSDSEAEEYYRHGCDAILHFVDTVINSDEKADSSVALPYLKTPFHMLRLHFPYIKRVIFQSDNAKNCSGNLTTHLIPFVARAAGLDAIGYYCNEAAAGNNMCGTHFSHKKLELHVMLI